MQGFLRLARRARSRVLLRLFFANVCIAASACSSTSYSTGKIMLSANQSVRVAEQDIHRYACAAAPYVLTCRVPGGGGGRLSARLCVCSL